MGKHGVAVVVGIPTFGMVSHYFAQARQGQQFPLVSSSIDCYIKGKPIAEARNDIVQYAIDADADYIYWLDDDVIPPPDAFLKLWNKQKDIINGVYWSKSNPPMPLLFRGHLEMPYLNWHVGDLIEIDAAGNGLTLVRTKVYKDIKEKIGEPWYSTTYGSFPGAQASPLNNTEDLYFYHKAKQAGYKIWADTSVQAFHYDKSNDVMYNMPAGSPQSNVAWEVKPIGKKLIADLGAGSFSPYMLDEGISITFDIREEVRPDVICDIRHLPCPNETFDIVFSSHTLEHFSWRKVDEVLKEWSRVLKVGGELRLVVPNLRHSAKRILEDNIIPTDMWVMFGEQDYGKNFHAAGFTPRLIKDLVASLGIYENIQTKEGNIDGPPGGDSWNLQLKATKVRNIQLDNIAPEGMTAGPPPPNSFYPLRIYDTYTQREITEEEINKDLEWMGASGIDEVTKKKGEALEKIKEYPKESMDRAYFDQSRLEAEDDARRKLNYGDGEQNEELSEEEVKKLDETIERFKPKKENK